MDHPLTPLLFRLFAAIGLATTCFVIPVSPQSPSTTQITTIRTYSNLVVIDIVVIDYQGNPVRGLKQSDFSLTEDKKPQTFRHFEEHTAAPASNVEITPPPKLPPGFFTNKSAAPVNGPLNILLLDYLNTPLSAQPYARKQLMEFLDELPAGTRIAIFALTNRLIMLQGFTADTAVLKAALTSKQGAPQASDTMTDAINGGSMTDTTLTDAVANDQPAVAGMVTQAMVDDLTRFEAQQTSFVQDMTAQITLDAFNMLARYLMGIPGRKNVIWLSAGFPLDVEPSVNEVKPTDFVVRNDEAIRRTDNLLARSQVSVYPVDARGVFNPDTSLDVSKTMAAITETSGASAAAALNATLISISQQHLTMEAMAEDTGGHAFYNTNDLKQAVRKAIETGSNYYTLTYSPTNVQWDARFRTVKIKIDQPNVSLTHRNGYYAVDPNDRSKLAASLAATALPPPNTMATAMMHGGPDPAEIPLNVRIRPSDMPPQEALIPSNQANPDPKVKVHGPFKAYGVDLVPDAQAMNCLVQPNGNRHCSFEIWTFIYNRDGEKLITASNRLNTDMTPASYAKVLASGMAFHQEISVPVKGQYFLRTAVHDMISDRVGGVEVPIAVLARLPPLQPVAEPNR